MHPNAGRPLRGGAAARAFGAAGHPGPRSPGFLEDFDGLWISIGFSLQRWKQGSNLKFLLHCEAIRSEREPASCHCEGLQSLKKTLFFRDHK
jgi:hypothetical protein